MHLLARTYLCDTDCTASANNHQINMQKFQSEESKQNSTTSEKGSSIIHVIHSEEFKQNSKTSEKGYSIVQVILGGVMVVIGSNYTEDNLCPNGAAWWLLIAGICLLASNLIIGLAKMYKKCAERDGKIDCGEKIVMVVNSFSGVMTIVDFAVLIWGSIVVFGAWANWTDDLNAYKANPEELNFCALYPMMTAFVTLILGWVLITITGCLLLLQLLHDRKTKLDQRDLPPPYSKL